MGLMTPRLLAGTREGLWDIQGEGPVAVEPFAGHDIVALAHDGARRHAIVDGRSIWTAGSDGQWQHAASLGEPPATCLAVTPGEFFVGTEQAHLRRLTRDGLEAVPSFEAVEGRERWYTPWGDPADVRSIAIDRAGAIYANVHVGGVVRSRDGGRTWTPTLDIEVDVHQVLAHPERPGVVLAAAAVGVGVSRDGGGAWDFTGAGMHAHYLRAVAVAGDAVLVTASTGPGGRRSAVYRRCLDDPGPFERCRAGLPAWFPDNIDTGCLAASGSTVAFGTADGRVFLSLDAGATWALAAKGLPEVHSVLVV
jgi:hypothetical protein